MYLSVCMFNANFAMNFLAPPIDLHEFCQRHLFLMTKRYLVATTGKTVAPGSRKKTGQSHWSTKVYT